MLDFFDNALHWYFHQLVSEYHLLVREREREREGRRERERGGEGGKQAGRQRGIPYVYEWE